jgi:hypothetical protein
MPCFITTENEMRESTVDAVNSASKVIKNHFWCDRKPVVLH